jgi:hypothetical protein
MISIELISGALERRILWVNLHVERVKPQSRLERVFQQSSAISHLWQAWVLHNRTVIVSCLAGKLAVKGKVLSSPLQHLSEMELLYHAQQYSEGKTPKPGKSIKSHLSEPNWGDMDKILNICSGAGFANSSYISACFGLAVRIKDLQLCRNTCAHLTKSQIADFNTSRVRYNENFFMHPSDMMNWVDPETDQKLWDSWCGEMETITDLLSDK